MEQKNPKNSTIYCLASLSAILIVVISACGNAPSETTHPLALTSWPTFTPLALKASTIDPTKTLLTPSPDLTVQPRLAATPDANAELVNKPLHFILIQHASCSWDEFWCPIEEGIHDAARDMNVKVTILSPDKFDLITTASQIDGAVSARPDGIALTVSDPVYLHDPILRAIESGIPVVAYNAGSGPIKDQLPYQIYLGMDDKQAGYLGAYHLIKAGARSGVCIIHAPELTALQNRCLGFSDAFKENGLSADTLNSSMNPVTLKNDILDFAQQHPDVNAYMTTGPTSAQGFYSFLSTVGQDYNQILHGAFDLSPEIITNIDTGVTLFALDQQPYLQGYEAVFWLTMINRYGFKPAVPVMATGPRFVVKNTLKYIVDTNYPIKLTLVHHGLCSWDPYWCVLDQGAYDAARSMDVELNIIGPETFDLYKMAAQIDQLAKDPPDGIGVAIPDPVILHSSILNAIQTGSPVVAFDSGFGPIKDRLPYLTYIGQDEYESGYLGALRLINSGGKMGVCAIHQKGQEALETRCQGFLDAFKTKGLTAQELDIGGDAAKALEIIRNYAQMHPEANAYLTLGAADPGAITIYNFLKESGRQPGEILHGTFDLSTNVVAAIKNGTTLFTVDAQPYLQGYTTVTFLTLFLRKGIVPTSPITLTGPAFVDINNINFVELQVGKTR